MNRLPARRWFPLTSDGPAMYLRWTFHVPRATAPMTDKVKKTRHLRGPDNSASVSPVHAGERHSSADLGPACHTGPMPVNCVAVLAGTALLGIGLDQVTKALVVATLEGTTIRWQITQLGWATEHGPRNPKPGNARSPRTRRPSTSSAPTVSTRTCSIRSAAGHRPGRGSSSPALTACRCTRPP